MEEKPQDLAAPNSAQEILANAKKIAPWLSQKSDEIEQARPLTNDVVDVLTKTGAFRMNMPTSWAWKPQVQNKSKLLRICLSVTHPWVGAR